MADDFTEDGQIEQLKVRKVIIKQREFFPFIPIHLVLSFIDINYIFDNWSTMMTLDLLPFQAVTLGAMFVM